MSSPSGDVCELYTASDLVSCLTAKRQVSVAMTIRPLPMSASPGGVHAPTVRASGAARGARSSSGT